MSLVSFLFFRCNYFLPWEDGIIYTNLAVFRLDRRAPFVYTEEGKKVGNMLWDEILEECRSVDPLLELPVRAN